MARTVFELRLADLFISMNVLSRSSVADSRALATSLQPVRDVTLDDGEFTATSREPWLRLGNGAPTLSGRWVELIYEASLLDDVARPVLRCFTKDGAKDQILPGPIFGRSIWLGLIPSEAYDIWISPTDRQGPFAFRVVSLRLLSPAELIGRSQRPLNTLAGLYHHLFGNTSFAERHFRRSLMSPPLRNYSKWRDARRRPIEWSGIDAIKQEKSTLGPHIRVVLPGAEEATIAWWLSLLRTQPWSNWSLAAPIGDQSESEVKRLAPQAKLSEAMLDLESTDLVAVAGARELWVSEALAIAGSAARREIHDIFYGDEELSGPPVTPLFKPDWAPIGGQSLDWIGRAWFARVGWARSVLGQRPVVEIPSLSIRPSGDARVKHIARVLLSRPEATHFASRVARPPRLMTKPSASIIIPMRDRADLLRRCVAGLLETRSDFEAIIVDNGSVEEGTHRFLAELIRDTRFRILARPEPFNFSALCNAGSREARAATLVFLNNDTEARSPDWLEKLISWTPLPTVGAVGAKLIFPNGRLQHAGVIVGIDGHANHYELPAGQTGVGYFNRLQFPHELSAVTGACLAVEKAKFDAVGGFDAENLPVEFSDIDLCLRLGERGWTSLLEPEAQLIHHQAATRKTSRDQELRYATEVAYFKDRWRHRLRADPFFHPALSLDWHSVALG